VFEMKMCSASVDPIPSSTGCPKWSLKRRWSGAGSASPAVTVARTDASDAGSGSASSRPAAKPGDAKNSVGCSAAISSTMPGGVGGPGSRIAVAPTENGNVSELPSP
jgi:hypothetical protein